MKERLLEVLHYRRNLKALPKGDSLCYKGEKDGHGQTPRLIEDGFIPNLFEELVFPHPFNAGESIRRQNGKT